MSRQPRKWTFERAYHLDRDAADLDALREGVAFLEEELCKAHADGVAREAEEINRLLTRLGKVLWERERRLLAFWPNSFSVDTR
jgi:hypothetical protein